MSDALVTRVVAMFLLPGCAATTRRRFDLVSRCDGRARRQLSTLNSHVIRRLDQFAPRDAPEAMLPILLSLRARPSHRPVSSGRAVQSSRTAPGAGRG